MSLLCTLWNALWDSFLWYCSVKGLSRHGMQSSLTEQYRGESWRDGKRRSFRVKMPIGFSACCSALLLSFFVVACSDGTNTPPTSSTGGNGPQATPPPTSLSSLHWCGKPTMVFRDQADPNAAKTATQAKLGPANGTPTAISDWNIVKENLGFTIYLPRTLPVGSCLLSASGSLRDPIFGSNFTITYVLPDQSSVSFSQAPSRAQNTSFQCNVSDALAANNDAAKKGTPGATPAASGNPVQLCNGVRDKTNIVFSARGATPALEQFFQSLQPDVDWMPAK